MHLQCIGALVIVTLIWYIGIVYGHDLPINNETRVGTGNNNNNSLPVLLLLKQTWITAEERGENYSHCVHLYARIYNYCIFAIMFWRWINRIVQCRIFNISFGGAEKLYIFLTHVTCQTLNCNHGDMEYNPYTIAIVLRSLHYDKNGMKTNYM